MINLRLHTRTAFLYFCIAAFLGVFLRLFFVTPIGANFRYVVHAHSHIALLGWVYLALITLIYRLYIPPGTKTILYKRIFQFTQNTLIGMLCTFPFTGYALWSIIFSTLFLFSSYITAWYFFKNVDAVNKQTFSFKCIRAALWYMLISSVGPWAVGGVMATLGKTSIWYKLSIYFYLHFQYNAWFILALCGILFYFLEKNGPLKDRGSLSRFFYLTNVGIVLSLFLSALWLEPHWVFYVLGALGAIFQLMGFLEFSSIVKRSVWTVISPFQRQLLRMAFLLLWGKILLQVLSAIPFFADLGFRYPDFIIGYLHWTFLGVVSISLLVFLNRAELLLVPPKLFWLYLTGFILSELLIFYKGVAIWLGIPFLSDYFLLLALVSALMPLALGLMLWKNQRSWKPDPGKFP